MSDDDEMPELEDFTEQLKEIRKAKGIDEKNVPTNIKVGVIDEKNISTNDSSKKNNTVQIPISTNPPPSKPQQTTTSQKTQNNNNNNKRDEDNFGCGLFKRGFLKRHNFSEDEPKKTNNNNKSNNSNTSNNNKEKEKKNEPVDLTHIKSNPGTTTKTNI